jgi:hypothetical protein
MREAAMRQNHDAFAASRDSLSVSTWHAGLVKPRGRVKLSDAFWQRVRDAAEG